MTENQDADQAVEYEAGERFALVLHGRFPVALLPDMESAHEFVERSERYSMETPVGEQVVSIQWPVPTVYEAVQTDSNVTVEREGGDFIIRANGNTMVLNPGQAGALKNFIAQLQEGEDHA